MYEIKLNKDILDNIEDRGGINNNNSNEERGDIYELIQTHKIKSGIKIKEYSDIDVASLLFNLGIPQDSILKCYKVPIRGVTLVEMPPDWKWFLKMGFNNFEYIGRIQNKIYDVLEHEKETTIS